MEKIVFRKTRIAREGKGLKIMIPVAYIPDFVKLGLLRRYEVVCTPLADEQKDEK